MQTLVTQMSCITNKTNQTTQQRNGQTQRKGIVCYGCNESGHISRDCSNKTIKDSTRTEQVKGNLGYKGKNGKRDMKANDTNRPLNYKGLSLRATEKPVLISKAK